MVTQRFIISRVNTLNYPIVEQKAHVKAFISEKFSLVLQYRRNETINPAVATTILAVVATAATIAAVAGNISIMGRSGERAGSEGFIFRLNNNLFL